MNYAKPWVKEEGHSEDYWSRDIIFDGKECFLRYYYSSRNEEFRISKLCEIPDDLGEELRTTGIQEPAELKKFVSKVLRANGIKEIPDKFGALL
jgi:hypothetical protein